MPEKEDLNRNIALLGYADLRLGASDGGGYNLVAQQHALYLAARGYRVSYLRSGMDYSFQPRHIRYEESWNDVALYNLWNSLVYAPGERDMNHNISKGRLKKQVRTVLKWLKKQGISRVFIHSLEGQPLDLINSMKREKIQVNIFCHDYFYVCPRVNFLYRGRELCFGNERGEKCVLCANKRSFLPCRISRALRRYIKKREIEPAGIDEYNENREMESANFRLLANLKNNDWGEWPRKAISSLNQADRVFAPSRFLGETLIASGLIPEKLKVIKIGLPHLNTLSKRVGTGENKPIEPPVRFAFKSGTADHKGIGLFIEALNRLPEDLAERGRYLFWGIDRSMIREKLKIPEEYIRCHERYNPDDLYLQQEAYDIGILSHLWFENAPIVLQEHLIMGKPVITTALGGVDDFVEQGKNGWIVLSGNPDDLRDIIATILINPTIIPRVDFSAQPSKVFFDKLLSE